MLTNEGVGVLSTRASAKVMRSSAPHKRYIYIIRLQRMLEGDRNRLQSQSAQPHEEWL